MVRLGVFLFFLGFFFKFFLVDVVQYGFPPAENEVWIEGQLAFEGGAIVFSESCASASSSSSSFLLCDVLVGDRVVDCDELNIQVVNKELLEKDQKDVAYARSRGIWAIYSRDRAIPRFRASVLKVFVVLWTYSFR
jgi:hypothetical protein